MKAKTPTPAQLPILRKAFEAQARDSHGFALGMHGGYRNPITQREWKWFVAGAGVAVPPLVDNQRRLLDALQNLCDVQGIEALALPAVLAARALIASASSPHDQGAAAYTAGVKRMDNPYWRKGMLDSQDCKDWDAGWLAASFKAKLPTEPARCAVKGQEFPGAMCSKHRVGGGCGYSGDCQHKAMPKDRPAPATLEADVTALLTLLEEREWAEHCTKTELGQRLEAAITELHNEITAARGEE